MKKFPAIFLLLLIFTGSCKSADEAPQNTNFPGLESMAKEFLKKNSIKGMAVALFTSDEILWKINLGKSTYGFPVNDSTLFSIQSVSKNMTALAVMMATEEGLVSLDSPIKDYLPGFTVNSCFDDLSPWIYPVSGGSVPCTLCLIYTPHHLADV
jgi:CubicO group peptidase (beta-lactamase class C family)